MRVRRTPAFTLVAIATAGFAVAALSSPPDALPTTNAPRPEKAATKSYAVYDAHGRRIGSQKWRLTAAGGNCCEVFVTATRTGQLVEFGGTYPVFSNDEGRTWTEVQPLVPSSSRVPNPGPRQIAGGEGTLVMAPGGDILGIGWDPYSGDHLQSFFYSAKEKKWSYLEAPLHEPFYDREWNTVAKGPFTINGQTYPYVGLVLTNEHRKIVLMSTDGLHYFTPTQRDLDAVKNGTVTAFLPVKHDPDLDYMQEQSQTGMAMLTQGALSFDSTVTSCKTQILKLDGTWACFKFPNEVELTGPLHTDSRGWLHEVTVDSDEFVYRMSRDGGRKWTETSFPVPSRFTTSSNEVTWDFKVNGKLGMAVIAVHALDPSKHVFQDIVMRFDVHGAKPVLQKIYYVGDGNLGSSVGLNVQDTVMNEINNAKSNRVDFTSVAILPNGRIAVSFADKTYDDPALAILM